ncbi:uncharacterized protein LOC131691673 [Topomyia yanbarensis]|uniref:uncharacterized protein LOC131691673 n=1 Tax=Topomyia yanbarensis TaxID=2498891 RepID=UPI00273C9522|nr:uncharacterized protein LOC131691673 [Topomyia yanbarensis]
MTRNVSVILILAYLIGALRASPTDVANNDGEFIASNVQQMMVQYRQFCVNQSGSDEGFSQIISSLQPAKKCVMQYVYLPQFKIDVQTSNNRKELFDNYCPKFNESLVCFDGMIQGVAKCIGQDMDDVRIMLAKMVSNVLEVMCKNDGEIFLEVRKAEFQNCMNILQENGQQCMSTKIKKTNPITQYGWDKCRELRKYRKCVDEKVDVSCKTTAFRELIDALFRPIVKDNNCHKVTTNLG